MQTTTELKAPDYIKSLSGRIFKKNSEVWCCFNTQGIHILSWFIDTCRDAADRYIKENLPLFHQWREWLDGNLFIIVLRHIFDD